MLNCRDTSLDELYEKTKQKSKLALADDTVDVRSEPLDDFTHYF